MLARWLEALLLPPTSLLVLAGAGALVARRRKRLGLAIVVGAGVALLLASLPIVSASLLRTLEPARPLELPPAPSDAPSAGAPGDGAAPSAAGGRTAIVVLGADIEVWTPEYGGATVGALTLERLRYGAWLHRRSGWPLLVTGGRFRPDVEPLGRMMAAVLTDELGVAVRWVEPTAGTTRENATRSAELLRPSGIDRVILVTHAWHVPRAASAFRATGLEVVPAPTLFHVRPRPEAGDFVPSAKALRQSSLAVHEWIGRAWYAVRGYGG